MIFNIERIIVLCLLFFVSFNIGFSDVTSDFEELLNEHWQQATEEQVFFRMDPDAWRMQGKLASVTKQARERRAAYNQQVLNKLAAIDINTLLDREKVIYQVFKYERETEAAHYQSKDHLFPIHKLGGYHRYFAEAPANMSFLTAKDYDNYLISLADFPRYNDEHISLLQEAVDTGYTHYCESLKGYENTILENIVVDPTVSALYIPFKDFPANVKQKERLLYQKEGKELIQTEVIPAFIKLQKFYREVYLPACREEVGIGGLPGGEEYYTYLARYYTTTDMAPAEIHQLGLEEIKRIRQEMDDLILSLEFKGEFSDFLEFLRSDSRFYMDNEVDYLKHVAWITKQIDAVLPKYFGRLPRNTFTIEPNHGRGTFYMPSSGDGTTPGIYFLGVKDVQTSPLYNLEALTFHEAMPGHHLQTALAYEINLPEFQRSLYHSAFGEGWGLYSERLGKEMGFYQDPYSDFGRLSYEMWRACRLVVDTGLHLQGWSRQKSIDFLVENTGLSLAEIESEVDRYITWPGQALSYKVGEIKIRELRKRAEQKLGSNFSLRDFHDTVIGSGSLPLAVLEQVVDDWIEISAKPLTLSKPNTN